MSITHNIFNEILDDAKRGGYAVGAFNIFNQQTLRGILLAAREIDRPIIIQTSEGTVKHYGAENLGSLVLSNKKSIGVKFALHLDHCRNEDVAKACVEAGWDSVMIDFSALPLEENISRTAEMVKYCHNRNVAVEGEVGTIIGVEDEISCDEGHGATYEETVQFIKQTGVDAIAPAIGTAHGNYKTKPSLDFGLVEQLAREACPIVIHGGTGLTNDQYRHLIELGSAKINISTSVKHCYFKDIRRNIDICDDDSPLQLDRCVEQNIGIMAQRLIKLFAGVE